MRISLDANVLISFLLNSRSTSPVSLTFDACFRSDVVLILSMEMIEEVEKSIAEKDYLRTRISLQAMDEMLETLKEAALVSPPMIGPALSLSRDPYDDYLIAHALDNEADVLITGDKDLLSLGEIHNLRIISPVSFVALLDAIDRQN